ncbi:protein IWS1 homolog, partial [Stegodyphus dumicola]|uniref:protein IWS1 homolog n=1 Tax=Stegodyphus dumicola TaxID=202533 RepID=UPI0015AAAF54
VLPQTVLADLRKEIHRQLGIDSVPEHFVFLRSVGRNFTQKFSGVGNEPEELAMASDEDECCARSLESRFMSATMDFTWLFEMELLEWVRPKQEMEMKVKNYIPPFAPEPELFLKEGHYTGPNNWSQGEDSGLEESLADSNSQRSHDRATPESLTDEHHIVLPKLTDFLDIPVGSGLDENGGRSSMPPGAMTISMSADDLSSSSIFHRASGNRKVLGEVPHVRPIRTDQRFVEDSRYRRIRERSLDKSILSSNKQRDREATNADHRENMRDGSWNRRQKRGTSKERGGTQLPTWAETRTTRLRRSRALGESNSNATSQQKKKREVSRSKTREPPPPRHPFDAEDEAEEEEPGKILMDRIRANSRCLKAQLASRRTVTDTGSASAERPSRERKAENHKNGKGHNGVYTMHARKNRRGGSENEERAEGIVEVETTAVKLLDEQGNEISKENPVTLRNDEPKEEPEIVHQHTLSVDGQDGRTDNMAGNEESNERHPEALEDISENSGSRESSESNNQTESDAKEANSEITDSDYNRSDIKEDDSERSQNSRNDSEVNASTNDLEEGRLVNQNGKLTIEVEVKELGSSEESGDTPLPSATLESNLTPVPVDGTGEYDSYRVYSEQNLTSSSVEHGQGESSYHERHSRVDASRSDDVRMKKAREARGVYLRRMEHRKSQSNVARTQSNEQGLDSVRSRAGDAGSPVRRYGGSVRSFSQNRKSEQSRLEKWSTSAASTGDLREAAWDYSYD